MNTKNVTTKSPEKCNNNNNHTSHKHSGPFYISSSLFENKRLKQKRYRWAAALLKFANRRHQLQLQQQQYTKTDRRKQNLSTLRADITIDLLSDDNDDNDEAVSTPHSVPAATPAPILKLPVEGQQHLQKFIVYPGQIELSKVPNITLIPVKSVQQLPAEMVATGTGASASTAKRVKRKRKSQQPKRHAQPTLVNKESIVLSDDSDEDVISAHHPLSCSSPIVAPIVSATLPAELTISRVRTPPSTLRASVPEVASTSALASAISNTPTHSAQVDEEVTVSIVPRSSAAGSCSHPNANELFPMLPDETTVHTVIANRTYELSLTKLREGLASCGIPEFANGQQKVSPTRRKGRVVDTPPLVMPPLAPISLKLSSDLSISLISDDEGDGNDNDNEAWLQRQHRNAENLLRKQPQLSVQHLQLPAAVAVTNPRQPPRRWKLG